MSRKQISAVDLIKLEVAPLIDGAEGTTFEEVPVVHEDTFTYEDEDPEIIDYKDVNGNIYYSARKPGALRMNASIGRYDLEAKQKFQGGKFTESKNGKPGIWERASRMENIEFSVRGTTADGVRIIFPRAGVTASGKANEKAIGLALVFTALQPLDNSSAIERWEDGETTSGE